MFGRTKRVRYLRQTKPDNCAQTVIAMALGVPVEVVEREAGTDGPMAVQATLDLLNRVGIFTRPISARFAAEMWATIRERGGGRKLRGLGFQLPRNGASVGHAYFLAGNQMYDPASGAKTPLNADSLKGQLDWLALFPQDAYGSPQFQRFLTAIAWEPGS